MSRDQVRQAITDYYASRGTAPQGNSIDYWTEKYFEFGDKDPEYYNRFLSNAEEFTGGRAGTAKGMFGIDLPGGAGGAGAMSGGLLGIDPSYAWRLNQGLEGVQRGAAARGTLLTGGTLKDLTDYAQGAASQEFGNIWARNMGLAGLGANAAGAMARYGSDYGSGMAEDALGLGASNAAGSIAQGNVWGGLLGSLGDLASTARASRQRTRPQPTVYDGPIYGPGY